MILALYIIWILLPSIFFVLALWSKLEQASGRPKRDHPGDLVRQGCFVATCVAAAIVIDQYILIPHLGPMLPSWLPLGMIQVMLLPIVLSIGASMFGPAKRILISKAPRPSQRSGGGRK